MSMLDRVVKVIARIVATFVASALSVIGAGSLFDVSAGKASVIAGVISTSGVVASLARSYLRDGKLTDEEINMAFASYLGASEQRASIRMKSATKPNKELGK